MCIIWVHIIFIFKKKQTILFNRLDANSTSGLNREIKV